jgi:cytochrome b subunit of formate dehydrogenase
MNKIGNLKHEQSLIIHDDEIFLRMNLAERIQHFLLIFSFFILILTGLPLFLYELKILEWLYPFYKGYYSRGILHRIAAVILIADII